MSVVNVGGGFALRRDACVRTGDWRRPKTTRAASATRFIESLSLMHLIASGQTVGPLSLTEWSEEYVSSRSFQRKPLLSSAETNSHVSSWMFENT